jgi:serine/threonine protein kinase
VGARADWWSFGIFLYQMVYGGTPFRGGRRDDTFANIVRAPLCFPEHPPGVSDECKDLITGLLIRDPAKRLGTRLGAEEVRGWSVLRDAPHM